MRGRIVALLLVAAAASSVEAAAQTRGLPVYNSGVPRGIGVYGDVAFPNADAGKGTAVGVTGRAGFGLFGATATLSSYNPSGPAGGKLSVGGTLNYRVFGGPLVPLSVTLQGGIAYAKPESGVLPDESVNEIRVPVGVGFALTIPNPVLAIRPWIAPRLDIVRISGGGASDTETNFGLGGGIELNLLSGLGAHAAYDMVFVGDGVRTGIFGIGLHYNFSIPGL